MCRALRRIRLHEVVRSERSGFVLKAICESLISRFTFTFTFTFMHLADAFIQSDLQCIQAIHVLSVCVP